MVLLEYAQFRNKRFVGWVAADVFPTREAAAAQAASRGLKTEGDDYLISDGWEYADGDGGAERGLNNLHDC